MADLKSPWPDADQSVDTPGLGGAGVISSGSDPNASGNPGAAGLVTPYDNAALATHGNEESANSVSGLPPLPNRFEPAAGTVEPPSLEDRRPGTIDQR